MENHLENSSALYPKYQQGICALQCPKAMFWEWCQPSLISILERFLLKSVLVWTTKSRLRLFILSTFSCSFSDNYQHKSFIFGGWVVANAENQRLVQKGFILHLCVFWQCLALPCTPRLSLQHHFSPTPEQDGLQDHDKFSWLRVRPGITPLWH